MDPSPPPPICIDPQSYEAIDRNARTEGLTVERYVEIWAKQLLPPSTQSSKHLFDYVGLGHGSVGTYDSPEDVVAILRDGRKDRNFLSE